MCVWQLTFNNTYQKDFWKNIILTDENQRPINDIMEKCLWFLEEGAIFGPLSFCKVTELALFALSEEEFKRVFRVPKHKVPRDRVLEDDR